MIAGVIAGIQDCWSLSEKKKKKKRPTGTSKYILDCVCIYFERAVNDPRLIPGFFPTVSDFISAGSLPACLCVLLLAELRHGRRLIGPAGAASRVFHNSAGQPVVRLPAAFISSGGE